MYPAPAIVLSFELDIIRFPGSCALLWTMTYAAISAAALTTASNFNGVDRFKEPPR
jgi:hypothetical protein